MTAGVASTDNRTQSDGELVAALVDGDLAALGALYGRHASLAYGLALRMTGDQRLAEEAVHAAFMGLWTDRREADGTDPVRLRLVRLVARAALDDTRRQRPLQSPGSAELRSARV